MKGNHPQLANVIARDSISLLYANSLSGIFVTAAALSILVFGFHNPAAQQSKYTLWAVMMGVLLVRLADYAFWRFSLKQRNYCHKAPSKRFRAGCIITAVVWSSYSLAIFDHSDIIEFSSSMIVICAMAGGSISVLAGSQRLSTAYSLILLVPMSLYALSADDAVRDLLAILGLVYAFVMLFSARKASSFTLNAIRLKNENALLLEQVKQEQQQQLQAHEDVKAANQKLDRLNASLELKVRQRTDEMYQMSCVDSLTGVTNRAAFSQHLHSLVDQSQQSDSSFALVCINIDDFKTINDTLGHKTGDRVLVELAKRLSLFGQSSHIGRWNGDEFLLTLPFSDETAAMAVAKAIKSSLSQPFNIESNQINLRVSLSLAMFPHHSSDPLELVQMANITLRKIRQQALVNPAFFTDELYAEYRHEQQLKDGLFNAINNKQLHLVYQPIIDSHSRQVWAFEALLRWNFNGKNVSPEQFIPLAEQSGLIRDIGAWVLNRACIDAVHWHDFVDASVSVNVSMLQLLDPDFIGVIDNALAASGLIPARLHLELTESVFTDQKELITAQLNAIKERGISIAIDDFGTGYSSLSQLQQLDFDHIKIDRSFVQNLQSGDETIIRATMNIAREMHYHVVAEGIESEQMANRLAALGANSLQGYWIAKPMPNDQLAQWHGENITKSGFNSIKIA